MIPPSAARLALFAALAVFGASASAQPLLAPPPPPGSEKPAPEAEAEPVRVAALPSVIHVPTQPAASLTIPAFHPAESHGPPTYGPPGGQASFDPEFAAPAPRHWLYNHAKLRHSSSHGRAMGPGSPLRGTSWLNRPYEVAAEFGAFLMTGGPAPNVRHGNDTFTAIQIGLDFDHYWGTQLRIGAASPRLLNTTQIGVGDPKQSLSVLDASFLYYPWGDSRIRPYYRVGIGLTELEYLNDNGFRVDERLLTFPFGVGLKYQLKKAWVLRCEVIDNFAIGMNETDDLHNLTITGGLEWRWGNGTKHLGGWSPLHHR